MEWLFNLSGIAALLAVLGAGSLRAWKWFRDGDSTREDRLTAREHRLIAELEKDVAEFRDRLDRADRTNAAMVSCIQVVIDYTLLKDPADPMLTALSHNLKAAFPPPQEMPSDIAGMLRRLDNRPGFTPSR